MYHFIVNPASRSGKGLRIWKEQLEPVLIREQIPYKAYYSEEVGAATPIVTRIIEEAGEYPIPIVVLGGDGTVNEALNGITNFEQVHFAYIPTGSSNDLARDLKLSKDPLVNLDQILHHNFPKPTDYGVVTYDDGTCRRFATSCGIGFDAAVCEAILHSSMKSKLNKLGLGKLTYLGMAIKQIFTMKPVSGSLTLDDDVSIVLQKTLFIACMNRRFEGGGFQFAPDAKDEDGVMDICAVDNVPRPKVFIALPTAFFGKHYRFRGINGYKGSKIRIEMQSPMWVHTDGEVEKQSASITVSCIHKGLLFIRP